MLTAKRPAGAGRADAGHGERRLTPLRAGAARADRGRRADQRRGLYGGLQRLLLRDPRSAGRGAATSPPRPKSARCSARWSARRWPIAGRAPERRPTRSMPSLGRGAGRWPPMRCGCCAAAGFAGEVHFVETSPVLRAAQADARAGARCGTTRSTTLPPTRRCCSSPTNSSTRLPIRQLVGGDERRVDGRRRRPGLRPRRRDRRGFAGARRGGRGELARASRRARRRRR